MLAIISDQGDSVDDGDIIIIIMIMLMLAMTTDQPSLTTRVKRGGACETTKDCVAGNVCSKYYNKVSLNILPILP